MNISFFSCPCSHGVPLYGNGNSLKNDSIDILDQEEGALLNNIASTNSEHVDFRLKKEAFFTGASGRGRINKYHYFTVCEWLGRSLPETEAFPYSGLYVFEPDGQERSSYYAAVVWGSVMQMPSRKKVLRKIRKKTLPKSFHPMPNTWPANMKPEVRYAGGGNGTL